MGLKSKRKLVVAKLRDSCFINIIFFARNVWNEVFGEDGLMSASGVVIV